MSKFPLSFHSFKACLAVLALAGVPYATQKVDASSPAVSSAPREFIGKQITPAEVPGAAQGLVAKPTPSEASRFLLQSTFGPTEADIKALVGSGYSAWFRTQLGLPKTSAVADVVAKFEEYARRQEPLGPRVIMDFAYRAQVDQVDQLRQRMVFALSQILVTSIEDPLIAPQSMAGYIDILNANAFGNYRDLLEDVTYSPAMAAYLTYLNNRKANAQTGSMPDENYAREILQLFTIGLVKLNRDGTPKTDAQGRQIETYTNADITGLAKVFTGLSWNHGVFGGQFPSENLPNLYFAPLKMWPSEHSPEAKTFLGKTIPAGTDGATSIDAALDTLFAHPNVAPFVAKQLIQRFVTSNPSPDYVRRVADAFTVGAFVLPDRSTVGSQRKGDLTATLAAILFDREARDQSRRNDPAFGRLREPALRFAHWARVAEVNTPSILGANGLADNYAVQESKAPEFLGQQQYRSPSVFNFYRPGYVAAGSETAGAGLVVPEMQITTTSSVAGYANFMRILIEKTDTNHTFRPTYAELIPLAEHPDALVEKLDLVMTANTLAPETRQKIASSLNETRIRAASRDEDTRNRINLAMVMIVLSPEYAVLR